MEIPSREFCCAFTGHRPESLPWGTDEGDPRCAALKEKIGLAIDRAWDSGYRHFICGMARGADFYFCEEVFAAKRRHKGLTVEAAVPFPGQSVYWGRGDRERYDRLVAGCDLESLIQHEYSKFCLIRRDQYMVNHACRLIAAFNGDLSRGGTAATLKYAMEKGIETDVIPVL